ncbi:MAG TPA: ABC transporter substrate-binding protein [Longimicrobium sp.]
MPVHIPRHALPLLLAAAAAACNLTPGRGSTVAFGLAAPLTRPYGENSKLGAELAAEELNAAGELDGVTIAIRARDDGGEGAAAIQVASRFVDDPQVLAVVGHANSDPMMAASKVYHDGELPAVGTSATSTEIAEAGPWIFRIASNDSANAAAIAREARRFGRRVGILYANDEYGNSLAAIFRKALAQTDAVLVGTDPYLEEMKDFRPYLLRFKERQAEVLLVAGLEVGASTMIRQMREVGLGARVLGGDGLESLTSMEGNYDGTMFGMLYHPEASDRARAFAANFRRRYNREPESAAATSYDAVYLLARALQSGARSRAEIREYLEGVGRPGGSEPFVGVTGPVAFDENGDPVGKPVAIAAIEGTRFRLVRSGR